MEILELEHKLLPMQEGDLRQGNVLLALCTAHPEAPETPWILEAYIEGMVKVLQALPELGLEMPVGEDALIWPALDQWLQQRRSLADQAQGLVWRGQIHALTGDYRGGLADLRAALELDPNHFEARWLLAKTIIQEAPGEAADHLEALRRRRPEDARVRFTLAETRRTLGQLDEAGRLLDEILAAAPNDVPALLERARVALDAQQPADAEPWLRRAEELAPIHPDVHLTLSRCLHLAGRLEEAERYQTRFQQLDTDRKKKQEDLVRKIKSARHG
jgi:predicted Zn-dependent protease